MALAGHGCTTLWDMGVPVGFTSTLPPCDEGVVKGSRVFIGASDGLSNGKERDADFGVRTFVGAKVGQGDGMNGGSLQ